MRTFAQQVCLLNATVGSLVEVEVKAVLDFASAEQRNNGLKTTILDVHVLYNLNFSVKENNIEICNFKKLQLFKSRFYVKSRIYVDKSDDQIQNLLNILSQFYIISRFTLQVVLTINIVKSRFDCSVFRSIEVQSFKVSY